MKALCTAIMLAGCLLVAGCGGSSGPSAPSAPPSLNVSLSAASGSASATEGATTTTATVSASVSASGPLNTPVVAVVGYDNTVFSSVTAVAATGGGYTLTATTQPNLGGATYSSPITFRLCQDASCAYVYAGSSATYTYNLTVNLRDWTTFQRDATHTGYVHTILDVTKFQKAWAWTNPAAPSYTGINLVSAVISANGSAYLSAEPGVVYSLNEASGAQNWSYDLGISSQPAVDTPGAPAYANGTVYVPAFQLMGTYFSGAASIRGVNAVTGAPTTDSPFSSQSIGFNSPVVLGNDMFYSAGYYGGVSYDYALPAGTATWTTSASVFSNEYAGETPAVDQTYVYYSTEYGLVVYNRSDGSLAATISDTRNISAGADDFIAPVIAPSGHIIIDDAQSGNQIVAVNVASKSFAWRTTGTQYGVQPAVAGNVIYASHANATGSAYTVDAISDTDGSVTWSWTMPSTDTRLMENMVVCDNLLFVSSDKNVYAIDLTTHQTVWTYAAHGKLSLSSRYVLYVVTNDYGLPGTITAIKLVS